MLQELKEGGLDILHAALIVKNADKSRYGKLDTDLSNAFIFGKNQYSLHNRRRKTYPIYFQTNSSNYTKE